MARTKQTAKAVIPGANKRKREDESEEREQKKYKIINDNPMLKLSEDELSMINGYLAAGELVMLACTCKSLFETITNVVKTKQPISLVSPWTLGRALQTHEYVRWHEPEKNKEAEKIIARGDFRKLCPNGGLRMASWEADSASVIEHFRVKKSGFVTLPSIKFESPEDNDDYYEPSDDFEESEIEDHKFPVTLGHDVKRIQKFLCHTADILQVLHDMIYLEEFEVEVTESGSLMAKREKSKQPKKAANWYSKKHVGVRVLQVEDSANMKEVVKGADLEYEQGKGYYQVTKKESLTDKKKIIVIDEQDQTMFRDDDALEEIGIKKKAKYDINVKDGYVIFAQSTSHNRKLPEGSYVLYETDDAGEDGDDGEDEAEDEEEEESEEGTINVPMLNNMKHFTIKGNIPDKFVAQLLQLMPNLESFKYVYTCGPNDNFIRFLADHCPKLKKLELEGDDGATPPAGDYHDDALLYLISKTKLQHLDTQHCGTISGELFAKMHQEGQNMRFLSIDKNSMEGGDFCSEPHDLHFGGVMPNMRELYLGGNWEFKNDEFFDTLPKAMPNLKRAHLSEIYGHDINKPKLAQVIGSLDLEEVNLPNWWAPGTSYYTKDKVYDDNIRKAFVEALQKSKSVKKIEVTSDAPLFTLDELQKSNFPSVTEWNGPMLLDAEYLEAFHKAFPNVTTFRPTFKDKATEKQAEFIHEFVNRDDVWPKLEMFTFERTDYDKKAKQDSFVDEWLKDRSKQE